MNRKRQPNLTYTNLLAFTSPLPKKGPIPIYLNALTKRTIKETVLQILKYPTNR